MDLKLLFGVLGVTVFLSVNSAPVQEDSRITGDHNTAINDSEKVEEFKSRLKRRPGKFVGDIDDLEDHNEMVQHMLSIVAHIEQLNSFVGNLSGTPLNATFSLPSFNEDSTVEPAIGAGLVVTMPAGVQSLLDALLTEAPPTEEALPWIGPAEAALTMIHALHSLFASPLGYYLATTGQLLDLTNDVMESLEDIFKDLNPVKHHLYNS